MRIHETIATLLTVMLSGCVGLTPRFEHGPDIVELESSATPPTGRCRIYDWRENLMAEGNLVAGKLDGTWSFFGSQSDRLAMLSYENGVLRGPFQMWYGPWGSPAARGRLKLDGGFVAGRFDGPITRYHPAGPRRSVRIYERGVLKSTQLWAPDGTEQPAASAKQQAILDLKADLQYLKGIEENVSKSLAEGRRRIRQ